MKMSSIFSLAKMCKAVLYSSGALVRNGVLAGKIVSIVKGKTEV